jgi:chromosomal replication initiation ATPase DnaA
MMRGTILKFLMTKETMIIKVTEELEKEDFSTARVFEIISYFRTIERDWDTYSEQNILDLFNLDMKDIRSKDRRSKITLCRHLICWYYKTKGYSHEAIGEKIDRKHCTITNSLKKVRQYYEAKDPLLMGFVYLDEQLNQILKRNV